MRVAWASVDHHEKMLVLYAKQKSVRDWGSPLKTVNKIASPRIAMRDSSTIGSCGWETMQVRSIERARFPIEEIIRSSSFDSHSHGRPKDPTPWATENKKRTSNWEHRRLSIRCWRLKTLRFSLGLKFQYCSAWGPRFGLPAVKWVGVLLIVGDRRIEEETNQTYTKMCSVAAQSMQLDQTQKLIPIAERHCSKCMQKQKILLFFSVQTVITIYDPKPSRWWFSARIDS